MIILGIDPGLATLGYGILDKDKGGNVRAVDYGVVLTPKEENLPVRLAMLEEGIGKILDKFSPDEVAVEELFFSKNVTTGIAVAHARGVALLTCVKRCGRLFEYTPMQIKQALTGYGKADKRQMQQVTASLLKLTVVLPSRLREIAGIKKDVVTVGRGKRLEIWSAERYNAYLEGADYDAEFKKLGI